MFYRTLTPLLLLLFPLLSCGEDILTCAPQDGAELFKTLEDANECHLIRLGGGTFKGNFIIPAGTAIHGDGASFVGSDPTRAAIVLEGSPDSALPTLLRDATLDTSGVGILASGGGHLLLDKLTIINRDGVGIVLDKLDGITIRNTTIAGSLSQDPAPTLDEQINPLNDTIAGLMVSRSALEIESLQISGCAGFGAVLHDTTGQWTGGGVDNIAGTGVALYDSEFRLERLILAGGRALEGQTLDLLSAGVQAQDSLLTTQELKMHNHEGLGMLLFETISTHAGLDIRDNAAGGLWVQDTTNEDGPSLTIAGEDNIMLNNGGSGLLVINSTGIQIENLSVDNTGLHPYTSGDGEADFADGAQLVALEGLISIAQTTFERSARVGLFIVGSDDLKQQLVFEEVSIEGAEVEEALGLVLQNTDVDAVPSGISVQEELSVRDMAPPELQVTNPLERRVLIPDFSDTPLVDEAGLFDTLGRVSPSALITAEGLSL